MRTRPPMALLVALLPACAAPPTADPDFDDAAAFLFREFETQEPARLAFVMRAFGEQIDASLDLSSEVTLDRTTTPGPLTEADLWDVDHPDADPSLTLTIAVARLSNFPPVDHRAIQLLADHTPVEPNSPNLYDRTFLDGTEACWGDQSCATLRTSNSLVRENLVLEIPYGMGKTFRWIDLGLPDPSTVPEGDPVVNPGEPEWGLLGRSWVPEEAIGVSGQNTLHQQYSVEVWLPRDGGSLRTISFYFELSGGGLTDELQLNVARAGIDDIFKFADDFLAE
jgi:hypothetical protein